VCRKRRLLNPSGRLREGKEKVLLSSGGSYAGGEGKGMSLLLSATGEKDVLEFCAAGEKGCPQKVVIPVMKGRGKKEGGA